MDITTVNLMGVGMPGVGVWQVSGLDELRGEDVWGLTPEEKERISRFGNPRDGRRFGGMRAAVRKILAEQLGVEVAEVCLEREVCPLCHSTQHGPPGISRPSNSGWVSWAKSGGDGVVAFCPGGPVGIDFEKTSGVPGVEIKEFCFTAKEAQQYGLVAEKERGVMAARGWVRKEAVGKACGVGLGLELRELEVRPEMRGRVKVHCSVGRGPEWWEVVDLPINSSWTGAVAVASLDRD